MKCRKFGKNATFSMGNGSLQIMKKETPPGELTGNIYPVMSANPQTSWLVTLRDFANVIFLLGSATYGMHFLWKVSNFSRGIHNSCM